MPRAATTHCCPTSCAPLAANLLILRPGTMIAKAAIPECLPAEPLCCMALTGCQAVATGVSGERLVCHV